MEVPPTGIEPVYLPWKSNVLPIDEGGARLLILDEFSNTFNFLIMEYKETLEAAPTRIWDLYMVVHLVFKILSIMSVMKG